MMIVTPEQLIKQYFPEPIATTRELYKHLNLEQYGYSYLDWLKGAEEHCLSQFVNELDYKLLPEADKNYWISEKVFFTLIQASPSKICDEIRAGLLEITNKIATDRDFARRYRDQLDQEYGIAKVTPKVSKKLKAKFNELGRDAFEFSVQADTRLYLDIITNYNFKPGQKLKNVFIFFKLEIDEGVPYHIIDITLSLTNDDILKYRTIWCCSQERLRYGAILGNKVIRINLFEENRKLVDSYEYSLGPSDIKTLVSEMEKVIGMITDLDLSNIDLDRLGQKILHRYTLNEELYTRAVKAIIFTITAYTDSTESMETAFLNAVDKYWEYYVLQPDPTKNYADDVEQMINERIPRVTLGLIAGNMLGNEELCDKYFKRRYSKKQRQALLNDGNVGLIYALSAADFDPDAVSDQRTTDICVCITNYLDLMKNVFIELGQWPATQC